jgi:heme/copper-type cytochrome/quinol oxidase subunit 3
MVIKAIEYNAKFSHDLFPSSGNFLAVYFTLTGLHALHVIGGLVSLIIINKRAAAGRYSIERHAGIVYTAMYWHFLDGMWLVIFVTLLIGT